MTNKKMDIFILSDNIFLIKNFKKIIIKSKLQEVANFDFYYSYFNKSLKKDDIIKNKIKPFNIKENYKKILNQYNIVFSLHSKQIFPKELVNNILCVNVHPGLNPYNRGWFPQVFSIINKLPAGATIHVIDEFLDHGKIIDQEKVKIQSYDTSLTAYNKIQEVELKLIEKNIESILNGTFKTFTVDEGNLNLKSDYNKLLHLDLDNKASLKEHIDLLRALTHGDYKNAYYLNELGEKIYISINLEKVN